MGGAVSRSKATTKTNKSPDGNLEEQRWLRQQELQDPQFIAASCTVYSDNKIMVTFEPYNPISLICGVYCFSFYSVIYLISFIDSTNLVIFIDIR